MRIFKKAQGLSLNMIIVAAIALLVLVVIYAIFTGRLGLFSSTLDNCETVAGGDCSQGSSCLPGYRQDRTKVCYDDAKQTLQGIACCVPESP